MSDKLSAEELAQIRERVGAIRHPDEWVSISVTADANRYQSPHSNLNVNTNAAWSCGPLRKARHVADKDRELIAAAPTDIRRLLSHVEAVEAENARLREAGEALALWVEMRAANRAYDAGLGVGEWEAFLESHETQILKVAFKGGLGEWAREGRLPPALSETPND